MRLIGRILLLAFVLASGFWLATIAWPRVALYLAGGSLLAGDDVRTAIAYVLPPGKDVEFVLARQPSRARVAIAALTKPAARVPEDAAWRIAWAALDENGAMIGSGEFTGACRAPATFHDPGGHLRPVRWSTDAALAPCADQLMFLRFAAQENAARIRLRLLDAHPAFPAVSVRVAQRVARSARGRGDIAWHRMDEESRNELARFQAWPAYLLTPGEIDALTAAQWLPVGPQGVAGSDFNVLTLAYLPADSVERNPEASGITRIADAAHHLTLPVFEGGEIALRLAPVNDNGQPAGARLTFHPTLPWQPSSTVLTVPPGGLASVQRVDRGLLEVESEVPLAVELVDADSATLEHEEHRQRVLRLDNGQAVEWTLTHAPGMTTALRLDVRGLVEPGGARTGEQDRLAWQWLDAQGRELRRGSLAPVLAPSPYDRPADEGIVTDPASVWFRLPDEVTTVRAVAHGQLLVNAWSRIDEAVLPRRVPAEQRAWFDDARRVPEWFMLDPEDWNARVSSGRSLLLRVQHRPLPPTRLGADTLVDAMAPREASAVAARIVLPLAAVPYKLAPQSASLYAPVDASCRVQFTGSRGELRVAPQLLFTGGSGLAPVTVLLDGMPLDVPAPAGSTGQVELPPLAVGNHRVCIEDHAGRQWYASHASASAARMIEGGGYRLDTGGTLSFDVRKEAAPLTLNVRWYAGGNGGDAPLLRAVVEGTQASGAFGGYTLPRTEWSLPVPGKATLPGSVLYRAGVRAGAPQSMNLTLDADLPAGSYRVRFTLGAGAGGWLGISRLEYAGEGATRVLYEVP